MSHLNYSFKKLRKTFKLQKEFLKTEMNQSEVDENNYKNIKDEWSSYVKNEMLNIVKH